MKKYFKNFSIMFIVAIIIIFGHSNITFAEDIVYTDNEIPRMTSYVAPSGAVSSSSKDLLNSHAYSAFTQNDNNAWIGDTVDSGWIEYEFPSPRRIEKYTIHNLSGFNYMYPRSFSLQASNTGLFNGEEVTLDTRRNLVFKDSERKTFICSTIPTTAYTYYRIVVMNSGGYAPRIEGIEMMERFLSLDKSSMKLVVNNSKKLTATLNPVGYLGEATWNSSDTSIATVDSTGKVTGIKEGQATVTATATKIDGTKASATCAVNVVNGDDIFFEMTDGNRYSVPNSQVKDFIQWYEAEENNETSSSVYKFDKSSIDKNN
ncbi:Ig-like domain-containing protein [Clostridium sp. YIM B02555]|uniref:Ig-like domain-containing protein n=1 Tax=Clostridium sp. YIM B02555 TaxID=2911968 RepID=UPI001EEDCCA8|nr:Ig-like domain-containing protein [Clostridium sp. YIM B02555]